MSVSQRKIRTQQQGWAKCTGTYKSTASASLRVVGLILPRTSVCGPAVVPWRETGVTVALLRVLHPLSHVVFTSERWRVGGRRGRGGGGWWRAITLLFSLPVRTKHKAGVKRSRWNSFHLLCSLIMVTEAQTTTGRTWISCGASQISQRTSLCSALGSLLGSGPLHVCSHDPCRQTSCASQYPSAGPSRRLWTCDLGPADIGVC